MSGIRVRLSRFTTTKVPVLSLVLVAIVGMAVGVFAATITVTPNSFLGEIGTYHNNTGTMTVTDNGLSIVSNTTGIAPATTATFPTSGNTNLFNGATFTAGHWMETLVFKDTLTDTSQHTVKISVNSNPGATAPAGSALITQVTLTLTGPGASAGTGTITVYLDLGVTTITAPLTVYVNST